MIQKLLGIVFSLLCVVTVLHAQPILLTVDGTFSDSQSGLLTGSRTVTISLNRNADLFAGNTGTELWTETLPNVTFSSGFMSVELGRLTTIKPEYFLDSNVIFIVTIDGVSGRVGIPVRYVPLAVRSNVSDVALRVSGNAIEGAIPASLVTGTLSGITGLGPLVTTLNSSAGLTIGTRTLFANPGSGRVGVGTSSPLHALDVSGNVRVTGQVIFADGSSLSSASSLATSGGGPISSTRDVTLEADNDVNFTGKIIAKVGGVERLVILNDGKVGIGTTVPIQEFEVNGGILVRNTTISNPGAIRFDGSVFEGYDGVAWRRLDIESNSAGGWTFDSVAGKLVQVMPTSKVGIGLTTPEYAL